MTKNEIFANILESDMLSEFMATHSTHEISTMMLEIAQLAIQYALDENEL